MPIIGPSKPTELDAAHEEEQIRKSINSREDVHIPPSLQFVLQRNPKIQVADFDPVHLNFIINNSRRLNTFANALQGNVDAAIHVDPLAVTKDDLYLILLICCWVQHFNETFLEVVSNEKILQTITRVTSLLQIMPNSETREENWLLWESGTKEYEESARVRESAHEPKAAQRLFNNAVCLINTMLYLGTALSQMFERKLEIVANRVWTCRLQVAQEYLGFPNDKSKVNDDLYLNYAHKEIFVISPERNLEVEPSHTYPNRAVNGLRRAILDF